MSGGGPETELQPLGADDDETEVEHPPPVGIERMMLSTCIGTFFEFYDYGLIIFFEDGLSLNLPSNAHGLQLVL